MSDHYSSNSGAVSTLPVLYVKWAFIVGGTLNLSDLCLDIVFVIVKECYELSKAAADGSVDKALVRQYRTFRIEFSWAL